jgi:glycosyltransferase involved in cell wall biosynthesis
MHVSVVIPAHDEAPAIGDVIARSMAHTPAPAEVLVIDDASSDGTAEAARAAGARVVRLERNQGKGAAIQRGAAEAVGDVLVFIDADGQDDPAEIPQLLAAMTPDVDLVLGSRFLGHFRPGAITRLNLFGTRLITSTVNVLFRTRVTDPLAGFRAIRTPMMRSINIQARGYDIEVDMLLRVLSAGGRVAEAPASRAPRPHGQSKLRSFSDGSRIMWRILRHRLGSMRRGPAGPLARGEETP